MKRASRVVGFLLSAGLAAQVAAGQEKTAPESAQADPIARIVARMAAAEKALRSLRLELSTRGSIAEGGEYSTSGTLHVLAGEQRQLRSSVRFAFADGLQSRLETAQTADGIKIYSSSALFGEVFVRVPPPIVADLEWAGEVLGRANLPGMQDARAKAPLGSSMVEHLRRNFDLEVQPKQQRGAAAGIWLAGARRAGLDDVGSDVLLPDRVELFVRDADHALLEMVQYQGDKELLRVDVLALEVDGELDAAVFELDGNDQVLRDVATYAPMWGQIVDAIERAEARLLPPDFDPEKDQIKPEWLRPSRRGK